MASWDDGYVSDVTYLASHHPHSSPVWMSAAATLFGYVVPDPGRPFRYADIGCGNGSTALAAAAAMPYAEFWGFDFNPAHIETARAIAREAGLTNIRFEEASFEDMANMPRDALPGFDYIVAHGVLSWVSLENRRRLFQVIGQRLTPGGVVHISYNAATGWPGIPAVRTLMRLLVEASPERTDLAVGTVFDMLQRMQDAGAAIFDLHPTLAPRLNGLRNHPPRYIAHELLNRDWHTVMFRDVAAAMAEIKCGFIASAAPLNNIDELTIPAPMRAAANWGGSPAMHETMRDIASAQGFRRDLYQRGPNPAAPPGRDRRIDAICLARTHTAPPETLEYTTPLGKLAPEPAETREVIETFAAGPLTIGEAAARLAHLKWDTVRFRSALILAIEANYLVPILTPAPSAEAIAACARLNRVHARLFDRGEDRGFLVYPAVGAAWDADPRDILMLDAILDGHPPNETALAETILRRTEAAGRYLMQDGRPIADPALRLQTMTGLTRAFLRDRLPSMRILGVTGGMGQ